MSAGAELVAGRGRKKHAHGQVSWTGRPLARCELADQRWSRKVNEQAVVPSVRQTQYHYWIWAKGTRAKRDGANEFNVGCPGGRAHWEGISRRTLERKHDCGSGRMARILVVDDNAEERQMYATMLYYNGFDVLEAEDAIAGLELARDEQPDLILMDYRLPRLDGLLAAELLQAIPETSFIPVVCVTAFNVTSDRARASGCRAVLAKPTRPHELISTVRRWLDGRPGQAEGAARS